MGFQQQLGRLTGDQFVPQVIFIFEIQVEGPLGQPGALGNVRDRCFGESPVSEQLIGAAQQGGPFVLFVDLYFSNEIYLYDLIRIVILPSGPGMLSLL
jgi:hypothetical protein